jgi:hypothetical protein
VCSLASLGKIYWGGETIGSRRDLSGSYFFSLGEPVKTVNFLFDTVYGKVV